MRRVMILAFSALPILALAHQGPVTARLASASVTFGPGIIPDRTGETPAPQFDPRLTCEVAVEGLKAGAKPRFRFWVIKSGDEVKLQKASPRSIRGRLLEGVPGPRNGTNYPHSIAWTQGAVAPNERLFVEVFLGRQRVATAMAPIESHYLPAAHTRGGEVKD